MAQDIETKVREKISEQLGVAADEVTPEASFIEDLGHKGTLKVIRDKQTICKITIISFECPAAMTQSVYRLSALRRRLCRYLYPWRSSLNSR